MRTKAIGIVLLAAGAIATVAGILAIAGDNQSVASTSAASSTTAVVAPATTTTITATGPTTTTAASTTTSASATVSTTAPTTAPTTISTTVPPLEEPAAFLTLLQDAIRHNDAAVLAARLDPIVYERYAIDSCAEYFASLATPNIVFEVIEVLPPAPWTWVTDDIARDVPDAITVRLRRSDDGVAFTDVDVHVSRSASGSIQWFTDCGTPKEQAR